MFSPLHRLGPPTRCMVGLGSAGSHNSARTAIRSRLCSPNTFLPLPILHTFHEKSNLYRTRTLFLSAQAWRLRIPLKTRSAHACAVQTRFRPSLFGVFFEPFLLKLIGLLRFGAALLRLSHAWPFSARNAIRSRLCTPNTHSPRPFFHIYRGNVSFLLRPTPSFTRPSSAPPNFSQNAIRLRLCSPNTHSPHLFFHFFSGNASFLLRPTPSFTRPSLAPPNVSQNAIRSRQCSPNTPPPIQFLRVLKLFVH